MVADTFSLSSSRNARPRSETDAQHLATIELRRELAATRAELNATRDELAEARHLHHAATETLAAARTEIAATRHVIARMERTLSWRLTAPFRELDDALLRLLGKKRR